MEDLTGADLVQHCKFIFIQFYLFCCCCCCFVSLCGGLHIGFACPNSDYWSFVVFQVQKLHFRNLLTQYLVIKLAIQKKKLLVAVLEEKRF